MGVNLYIWVLILLVVILAIIDILIAKKYTNVEPILSRGLVFLKGMLSGIGVEKGTGDDTLDYIIKTSGYSYDPKQDIFYSDIDAWQRSMGYCRLYDEAAAAMGMIIDCEPIYFKYGGKRWLIEFWKGQYDLTTGCEIGVYNTSESDLIIPGFFEGPFFNAADASEQLHMSFTLKKNGTKLFIRKGKHWWLTGFKLGEFSEPSELTMDLSITFKDRLMRNAFVRGLREAGYSRDEISIVESTVSLIFETPHTEQPSTRTSETDRLIQQKNKFMCDEYANMTKEYRSLPDKIKIIEKDSPEIFDSITNMGKNIKFFNTSKVIQGYLLSRD